MKYEFAYREIYGEKIITKEGFIYFFDIENEIKKYIKNIDISLIRRDDGDGFKCNLFVRGDFKNYYHFEIQLQKHYLIYDFSNYLKCIAYNIVDLISKELFIKKDIR